MQIDVDHLYCMYLARREDPCVERGIAYQVIKKFVDVFQVRYVVGLNVVVTSPWIVSALCVSFLT